MSDTEQVGTPLGESLRDHVLEPLEEARSVLEREHEEIDAEQDAFEQFRERITTIETVSDGSAVPATRNHLHEDQPHATERIRNAYYETVMSVDHYDEVYGESLVKNVAAELSDGIAAGLRQDTHLQFTHLYKQTLLTGVDSAIDQHKTFCAALDSERESLDQSRAALLSIMDELDGTHVPREFRTDFTEAVDEVARRRQETFNSRTKLSRTDRHDLCSYLYMHCGWTYPVLTAVARLQRAVNGLVT